MTAANLPSPFGVFGISTLQVRAAGSHVGDIFFDAQGSVLSRVQVVATGTLQIAGPGGSEIVTLDGRLIANRFGDGWIVSDSENSLRQQAIAAVLDAWTFAKTSRV